MAASAEATTLTAETFLAEVGRLSGEGDFRGVQRYCSEHLEQVRPLLTPAQWAGVTDGTLGWAAMCEQMEVSE